MIAQAKRHGARLVGTHLTAAAIDYREADYSQPLILLMGNEQQGLTEKLAAACDALVRIPMQGKADSLNLAVSTGLMIYEAIRGAKSSVGAKARVVSQLADAVVHPLDLGVRRPVSCSRRRQRAVLPQHDRRQHLHVVAQAGDVGREPLKLAGQEIQVDRVRMFPSHSILPFTTRSSPASWHGAHGPTCGNPALYSPRCPL